MTDDQQGGQKMHIENDELLMWIGETLEQMAQEQGMIVTKCPHCALPASHTVAGVP